jgi:hypothetical protein
MVGGVESMAALVADAKAADPAPHVHRWGPVNNLCQRAMHLRMGRVGAAGLVQHWRQLHNEHESMQPWQKHVRCSFFFYVAFPALSYHIDMVGMLAAAYVCSGLKCCCVSCTRVCIHLPDASVFNVCSST